MSLRNPFAELVGLVLGKSDLQSIFCLLVFFIVSIVIAYLTNPSENSFRAYLTEQSFRHHLSRLDENLDDDETTVHDARFSNIYSHGARARSSSPNSDNGPFHFANRASISLRTPKHVFHSFALFTIAAMVPVAKSSQSDDRDGWSISDSWYIGAFGKWWRGGVWETWYQDLMTRSKDEEGWNSGILSIKNLDMLPDFHGATLGSKPFPYLPLKNSPPRLRNRDRPPKSSSSLRNGSPPPLSKTASLPLHATKRIPVPQSEKPVDITIASQAAPSCPPVQPISSDASRLAPSSRSTSGLFEHSPLIAEILRQISTSQTSVQELRTQLTECQLSASQSHEILQHELDSCRDRKRQEDAARLELKARTKTLDDSKRSAESVKREAERKLKAAQSTRDTAQRRIDFLDKEIATLHGKLADDKTFLEKKSSDASQPDVELSEALEAKKKEIKATEDLLASLTRRSRELEDKLSSERERLQSLRQRTEQRRQELSQQEQYVLNDSPYSPTSFESLSQLVQHPRFAHPYHPVDLKHSPDMHQEQGYANNQLPSPAHTTSSGSKRGSFGSSSDDAEHGPHNYASNGYPYNLDMYAGENDFYRNIGRFGNILTDGGSSQRSVHANGTIAALTDSGNKRSTHALHEFLPYDGPVAVQNGTWPLHSGTAVDELGYITNDDFRLGLNNKSQGGKKGLNPDAKAFSLGRQTSQSTTSLGLPIVPVPYDALNPTGLSSQSTTTSTSSSLLRAFAPSPAEREALQRALGGSTNNSFERLPSLSDVGSIPSSPVHVHASAIASPVVGLSHTTPATDPVTKTLQLPSWFPHFLPRKSKFKPWDDEEPVTTAPATAAGGTNTK
ncbi:hypothetical protein CC1G_11548 [Coprinopsis cinerea okayama7|uniref:Uncharacterized protein n=1 Tax=Coprinopsis cinerea (strain Okayama-7 / 130 / ATCC MYA-4618 / FGSC 9003) TaxID=240176 RepID=A8N6T4_COPC7|nr:hypothetical protein CC1G_11548 [Coprinopsis cinerea okayama7\|eukprot:XP_001830540.2 hypothetical protein CC1G_11548 [Coprinopsis cinerea okayama7\